MSETLWYVINARGMLTLCAGENDARTSAVDFDAQWPKMAPHRAVQMVEYTPAPPASAEVQMPAMIGRTIDGLLYITLADSLAYAAAREAAAVERVRGLIEQCRDALAEELAAWDIDPPLNHVKSAHDACDAWLAAARAELERRNG